LGERERGIVLSCSADSFLGTLSCSPDLAGYSGLHILDVLSIVVILHYLSHSDNPDLPLKSQMSCPGSPDIAVAVLSWISCLLSCSLLSCSCIPVLVIFFWMLRTNCPVWTVSFSCLFPVVLLWLSCSGCLARTLPLVKTCDRTILLW
jgi:hypothetical protein